LVPYATKNSPTKYNLLTRLGFRVKVRFSHAINYKLFSKLYILKNIFDTFITYYFQNLHNSQNKSIKKLSIALVVVCEGWGEVGGVTR
jgi:hypothetical protein